MVCKNVTRTSLTHNYLLIADTDECDRRNGGCEHSCINSVGSFKCVCDEGYRLDRNKYNCTGKSEVTGHLSNLESNYSQIRH